MIRKSTIPKRWQLPIAAGLSALLIGVWVYRLWPEAGVEASASVEVEMDGDSLEDALARLSPAVQRVSDHLDGAEREEGRIPILLTDPLLPDGFDLAAWGHESDLDSKGFGQGPSAKDQSKNAAPSGPSRDDILTAIRVTGTASAGSWRMALVNGRYLHVGDPIGQFTIQEIRDTGLVIRDSKGEEFVSFTTESTSKSMELQGEVDWLFNEK